jgi:hypothetical protein
MLSSTYHTLPTSMASRRPLSPIEVLPLLLAFGSNYMNVWVPISSEAQPVILKLMDRLSESIESLKICFVLVF